MRFLIVALLLLASCTDKPTKLAQIPEQEPPKPATNDYAQKLCENVAPLSIASDPLEPVCTRTFGPKDQLDMPKLIDYYIKRSSESNKGKLLTKYNELWTKNFDTHIKGSQIKIFKAKPLDTNSMLCHELGSVDKIAMSIAAKPFTFKSDEAFADFANRFIGGGVLGHGFVQEEIMLMQSNFLPWVAEIQKTFGENKGLSWCPNISLTNLDKEPHTIYFGLPWAWTSKAYGHVPDSPEDFLVPTSPRKDFYAMAMAAKDYGIGEKYTLNDIEQMTLTATLAFYEAMLALNADNHPLKLTTGNWGAGAFNNSLSMAYGMQRLAIQAAYTLFKQAKSKDPGMHFQYDTFDQKSEVVVKKAKADYEQHLAKVKNLAQGIEMLYELSKNDVQWQVGAR